MYLWDTNILRHFGEGHPTLRLHLEKISWAEIALPSVVVAEVLRGRSDYALKASPEKLPAAHEQLFRTQKFLNRFNVIIFDEECGKALKKLRHKHKAHKKYTDMIIAAMAEVGSHIVVTRNVKDFEKLLPKKYLENWIDKKPG